MSISIEFAESKILFFCKYNNIGYTIDKQEDIIYSLNSNSEGISKILIKRDKKKYLKSITIYGVNDLLINRTIDIENNKSYLNLKTKNVTFTRLDYKFSELKIDFDEEFIKDFEMKTISTENQKVNDIFEQKDELKRKISKVAYEIIKSTSAISLLSEKYHRPEHQLIKFDNKALPDENGNINCLYCTNCSNCINCIGCHSCNNCTECTNCQSCENCKFCHNSEFCDNCSCCVDCCFCDKCFCGDSLNSNINLYIGNPFKFSFGNEKPDKHYFPFTGSILYHEDIESYFLLNHFTPFNRPYKYVSNNQWFIQWSISRSHRRYWVTEFPSPQRKEYFYYELSKFFLLNKLVYRDYELNDYFKDESSINSGTRDYKINNDNKLGLFVKIIDSQYCFHNINEKIDTQLIWVNRQIGEKSNVNVWNKHKYHPENGHIGEVVLRLITSSIDEPILIIRTFGMFYVPILLSGIEIIDVTQEK